MFYAMAFASIVYLMMADEASENNVLTHKVSAERARPISTVRSNELSSDEIPRTEQVTYEVIEDQLTSLNSICGAGE
jgi:hypothetical protein